MLWTTFSVGSNAYPAVSAGSGYPGTVDGTHPIGPAHAVLAAKVSAAVTAGVFA